LGPVTGLPGMVDFTEFSNGGPLACSEPKRALP
jgi:hypothetical protein